MNSNRRTFILQAAAAGSVLAVTASHAQTAMPMLAETDAQAIALGYKQDSTKVDAKAFQQHAATQNCANCQLYQGKVKEPAGPCPLFAGKQVAAAGWCTSWTKKAA
jgi:hypothetical protein